MKSLALVLFGVVAVLFAAMIFRLEKETQAMMIGLVIGALAGVPIALLLIWGLGRRGEPRGTPDGRQYRDNDRIVVINPPTSGYPGYRDTPALAPPSSPRQYTVYGEDMASREDETWRER